MKKKKVIIIGGGPSAIMCAIGASKNYDVTILEKNSKLGTKLLISGGGRCNVTNNCQTSDIIENVVGNGKFLYSTLNQFSNLDIIDFFNSRGCLLVEEDHGRMFPKSNKAIDVLKTLQKELVRCNVKIEYNCTVSNLIFKNSKLVGLKSKDCEFFGDYFVFATGGKSYSMVGTTGDGYNFAKKLGHSVTKLYPCEVPLVSNFKYIQNQLLKGVSFSNVEISVLNLKNKKIAKFEHDLLFTHFGLSGPGALRCSSYVQKLLEKEKCVYVAIDFFQSKSVDMLTFECLDLISKNENKLAINVLSYLINKKIVNIIFNELNLDSNLTSKQVKKHLVNIIKMLKNFKIEIVGTQSFNKAFVTGGGVNLKEIDPKTMKSKIQDNVSFCGELLDLNAFTGGFNITMAMCSGYVCGINI